jgi:hypothetical protein
LDVEAGRGQAGCFQYLFAGVRWNFHGVENFNGSSLENRIEYSGH